MEKKVILRKMVSFLNAPYGKKTPENKLSDLHSSKTKPLSIKQKVKRIRIRDLPMNGSPSQTNRTSSSLREEEEK